ncbi:sigma-54-dependent transcriptional regulator [Oceanirhabdus sp. W0125-5]|uniref:sigma-54-dependent transcriptional regulator n=1 Tax=Oceanirhabdus sp. W0125-5 TaxID=2999116 RepID=UPI0022F30D14|nr:sigma-54 dependent transcriptional regulator [Oceanirhabdus sp. W0125-5]WBW97096.1 sigma-54 dependent transcriptional regulator [Oceanirhabdus sp. W0125-5]
MKNNNNIFKILVVDDEKEYREVFQMILEENGYITEEACGGEEALEKLKKESYDLILTDLIMKGMDGIELLKKIKKEYADTEVIIATGYGTIKNAVEAMKKGAYTYFIKGHDPEELLIEIEKLKRLVCVEKENKILRSQKSNSSFMLSTKNKEFKKVMNIAEKAAKSNVNILILGESGVGKEVFARYIHECSDRKDEHFIAVNCHAFSESLLESELFGHEKGAFTGALDKRIGRFEAAHGGTLFLDETGDISLSTQVKLLRTIESKKIERIGSNKSIDVDFRLICATNKDLHKSIMSGEFREDLFYRISTITIEIPPLRERKEDIPDLINFFFEKYKVKLKKNVSKIEKEVMDFLLSYEYPGNVRELKNIVERLIVLSEKGIIQESDLPEHGDKKAYEKEVEATEEIKPLKVIRKETEAKYIEKVLEQCNYNITEAAKKLDISRRQLFNKITEYELK